MSKFFTWFVMKVIKLYAEKTKLLYWSIPIDLEKDVIVLTEEWSNGIHRYGLREEPIGRERKDDETDIADED